MSFQSSLAMLLLDSCCEVELAGYVGPEHEFCEILTPRVSLPEGYEVPGPNQNSFPSLLSFLYLPSSYSSAKIYYIQNRILAI